MFDDIRGYCTSIRQDADGYVAVLKPEYAIDGMRTLLWRDDGWVTINGAHVFIDDKGIVRGGAGGKFNGRNMSKDARSWYKKKKKFLNRMAILRRGEKTVDNYKYKSAIEARKKAEEKLNSTINNIKDRKSGEWAKREIKDSEAAIRHYDRQLAVVKERRRLVDEYKKAVASGASKEEIDKIVAAGKAQREKYNKVLFDSLKFEKLAMLGMPTDYKTQNYYTHKELNERLAKSNKDFTDSLEKNINFYKTNTEKSIAKIKKNPTRVSKYDIQARAKARAELNNALREEKKYKKSYDQNQLYKQIAQEEKEKTKKISERGENAAINRQAKLARRRLGGNSGITVLFPDNVIKRAKKEGITLGHAALKEEEDFAREVMEYYRSKKPGEYVGDSADDIVIPF